MINGIDISRWQGGMDFTVARQAGIDFVYIKASEGSGYRDPLCAAFNREARLSHLLAGAYHYFHPAARPAEQLAVFEAACAGLTWDLPAALDCEESDGLPPEAVTAALQALVELLHERGGRRPVIYTSAGWWNKNVLPWSGWRRLPLWVAHWNVSQPLLPRDWGQAGTGWTLWQYAGRGSRQGKRHGAASRDIDLDYFFAGRAEMVAWGLCESPSPSTPPEGLEARVTALEGRVAALEARSEAGGGAGQEAQP